MCADGIDDRTGFSYHPDEFNNVGIAYHNFYWQDLKLPRLETLLMVCQSVQRIDQLGKKIFVHCHAGTGRTALVICSYLIYSGMVEDPHEAIRVTREARTGALP